MSEAIVKLTKSKFREYNWNQQRIKHLRNELEELHEDLITLKSPSREEVSSSPNINKLSYSDALTFKIIEIEKEIEYRQQEMYAVEVLLDNCNGRIYPETDHRVYKVLKMHYMQGYSYQQIINRLNLDYSESGLRKRVDKEIADVTQI